MAIPAPRAHRPVALAPLSFNAGSTTGPASVPSKEGNPKRMAALGNPTQQNFNQRPSDAPMATPSTKSYRMGPTKEPVRGTTFQQSLAPLSNVSASTPVLPIQAVVSGTSFSHADADYDNLTPKAERRPLTTVDPIRVGDVTLGEGSKTEGAGGNPNPIRSLFRKLRPGGSSEALPTSSASVASTSEERRNGGGGRFGGWAAPWRK